MKKYYIIIIILVIVDQLTKLLVLSKMEMFQSITIVKNFFYLTLIKNTGAAWGILSGRQAFFYIVTVGCVIVLLYYLHKTYQENKLQSIGIACFIGGAIGNFIDRVRLGGVIDFFDFIIPVIKYDFPIFNIADITLVTGAALVLISAFKTNYK